jgi:hypothetical protein
MDAASEFSATAAGCPTIEPKIDSVLSKFISVCSVKGGSNVGRGTLGKDVDLQLCQFLIPIVDEQYLKIPIPVSFC